MWPIATDVAWSLCLSAVCLLVTTMSLKMAEPIEVPFGLCSRVGPRNHVLDEVSDLSIGRSVLGDGVSDNVWRRRWPLRLYTQHCRQGMMALWDEDNEMPEHTTSGVYSVSGWCVLTSLPRRSAETAFIAVCRWCAETPVRTELQQLTLCMTCIHVTEFKFESDGLRHLFLQIWNPMDLLILQLRKAHVHYSLQFTVSHAEVNKCTFNYVCTE